MKNMGNSHIECKTKTILEVILRNAFNNHFKIKHALFFFKLTRQVIPQDASIINKWFLAKTFHSRNEKVPTLPKSSAIRIYWTCMYKIFNHIMGWLSGLDFENMVKNDLINPMWYWQSAIWLEFISTYMSLRTNLIILFCVTWSLLFAM